MAKVTRSVVLLIQREILCNCRLRVVIFYDLAAVAHICPHGFYDRRLSMPGRRNNLHAPQRPLSLFIFFIFLGWVGDVSA